MTVIHAIDHFGWVNFLWCLLLFGIGFLLLRYEGK